MNLHLWSCQAVVILRGSSVGEANSLHSPPPLAKCFVELQIQENFDKREKQAQITFPLRHFSLLNVVK
jgi:hypothetical protein